MSHIALAEARVFSAGQPSSPSSRSYPSRIPPPLAPAALAQRGGHDRRRPIDLVRASVTRVVAVVQSQPGAATLSAPRRAQIRRIAEELFDFDEMARRALGQHWKNRSPQEQAEFVPLFVSLLERSYLTAIGNFPLSTITFQSESVDGAYADVRSRIITDRREVPVTTDRCRAAGGGRLATSWRTG
jgi:ABC-type transporter MlaC component